MVDLNKTANPKHEKFVQWNEETKEKMNVIKELAKKTFEDQTFEKEFKKFFLLAFSGKSIANLVSFFTMYIALNLVWSNWLGSFSSIVLGFGTALFLEGLKMVIFALSFKYIIKYKLVSKVTIIPLFLISAVTISFSLIGAYYLPGLKEVKEVNAIPLNDIASLKADTSNISAARIDAAGFYTKVSKTVGAKTYISSRNPEGTKAFNEKAAILTSLVTAHQKEVLNAITENISIKAKNEALMKQSKVTAVQDSKIERYIFVGVAAFLEILYFVLSFCCVYYLIWVAVEQIEDQEEREEATDQLNKKMQFAFSGQRSSETGFSTQNDKEIKPSIQFEQTAVATAKQTAVATAQSVDIEIEEKKEQTAIATAKDPAIATTKEGYCKLGECNAKFIKTVHNKEFCCKKHQQLYNSIIRVDKQINSINNG